MRTKSLLALTVGLVLLGLSLYPAVSQAEPQRHARMRENIVNLMLLRMTEVLELTEEQTAKIYPFFIRMERERTEIHRQIQEHMQALKMLAQEENPDKTELRARIEKIKGLRGSLREKDAEVENHMEQNLALVQQAKFLMFVDAFYRDLQDKLERARLMRDRMRQKKEE